MMVVVSRLTPQRRPAAVPAILARLHTPERVSR
jgi:hypothetical protein